VRGVDDRLAPPEDDARRSPILDEGGLQQQRHPGLAEESASPAKEQAPRDFFDPGEEDNDPAADKKVIDSVSTAARVYGVNESVDPDQDILPGF
jgi:type IV secretion system protein VirD4